MLTGWVQVVREVLEVLEGQEDPDGGRVSSFYHD